MSDELPPPSREAVEAFHSAALRADADSEAPGLARPTPDDRIQQMAVYDRAMLRALAMPDRTPTQRGARNSAIAGARIRLAASTNRHLNPVAVSRIDSLLGLPTSDPTLGVQQGAGESAVGVASGEGHQ